MREPRVIVGALRSIADESSGSVGRIRAMTAAFQALGYRVDPVMGRIHERLPAMRCVMQRLEEGATYDFVYMENHTIPLHLTEPRLQLLRRYPLADLRFLLACRRRGVPIGMFYRDAWWRFPEYRAASPVFKRALRWPFHSIELLLYATLADVVYVPHLAMAEILPIRLGQVRALPPGTVRIPALPSKRAETRGGPLRIFYVGGLGPFYRLHSLVAAVRRIPGVRLTVCCRSQDWQDCRESYAPLMSDQVDIVHAHGADLLPHFGEADVLSCFLSPTSYWRFTLPLKLFEYLGHAKPILAARDTNAGAFINEHDIGWTTADDSDEIADLLMRVRSRPDELAAKGANAARIAAQHTWEARARQVAHDLGDGDRHVAPRS